MCSIPANSITGSADKTAVPIAQRGVFVLEPILGSAAPESDADAVDTSQGSRTARGRQDSERVVVTPTVGWRLLMLAERTAEQMMQVRVPTLLFWFVD